VSSGFGELTVQAHHLVSAGDLAGAQQLLRRADRRRSAPRQRLPRAGRRPWAPGGCWSPRRTAGRAGLGTLRVPDERVAAGPTSGPSPPRPPSRRCCSGRQLRPRRPALPGSDHRTDRDRRSESLRVLAAHADLATVEYARGECAVARTGWPTPGSCTAVCGDGHRHQRCSPGWCDAARLRPLARGAREPGVGRNCAGSTYRPTTRSPPGGDARPPPLIRATPAPTAGAGTSRWCRTRVPLAERGRHRTTPGLRATADPPALGAVPGSRWTALTGPTPTGRPTTTPRTTTPGGRRKRRRKNPTTGPHRRRRSAPSVVTLTGPADDLDDPRRTPGPAPARTDAATRLPLPVHHPPTHRPRRLGPIVVAGVIVVLLGTGAVIAAVSRVDEPRSAPPPPAAAPTATAPTVTATPTTAAPGAVTASPGTPPTRVALRDNRDSIALSWTYPPGAEDGGDPPPGPDSRLRRPATPPAVVYGLDHYRLLPVAVVYPQTSSGRPRRSAPAPLTAKRRSATPDVGLQMARRPLSPPVRAPQARPCPQPDPASPAAFDARR
jgi:hypothetical protein